MRILRAILAFTLAALIVAGPAAAAPRLHVAGPRSPASFNFTPPIAAPSGIVGVRAVAIARLHSGSMALAMPIILAGGFSGGGGSAISDPHVPVDGTMNVTGAQAVSSRAQIKTDGAGYTDDSAYGLSVGSASYRNIRAVGSSNVGSGIALENSTSGGTLWNILIGGSASGGFVGGLNFYDGEYRAWLEPGGEAEFRPDVAAGTGDESAFRIAPTVNKATSGNYTALEIDVTETSAPGTEDKLIDLQVANISKFKVDNTANTTWGFVSVPVTITDGRLSGATTLQVRATDGQLTLYGNTIDLQDSLGGTTPTILLRGREQHARETVTGTDDGAGTARAVVWTPASPYGELDCQDSSGGCTLTISETGAVEGQEVILYALPVGVSNTTISDVAAQQVVTGASITLDATTAAGTGTMVKFMYDGTQWVQSQPILVSE
ncbi:MAG TPA: hypothetical protein VJP78_01590 [Thermoleophilia bacterium]|nr:hypothetical protein [Thermoleophilia bacterium]